MSIWIYLGVLCIIWIVLMFGVIWIAQAYTWSQRKEPILAYVNSVNPVEGAVPENNMELMSQMRPSDIVNDYLEMKFHMGNDRKDCFIAITNERLIFKAVVAGDNTANIINPAGPRQAELMKVRFNYQEMTTNIPVKNISSMSVSKEIFDINSEGCLVKENLFAEMYVLAVNAQGIVYKILLGKHQHMADGFVRTFTDMSYENDQNSS